MGKFLKIILSIFAAIILLIVIVAIALPIFIDPNDFKPQIQQFVKDNSGRDLNIEGNLDLSVFPWLGIATGPLMLDNADGFGDQPFAKIDESNIKVKLLPLLSKKLEVNKVILKGLQLNLAKNKQGVSNWDDLSSKPAEEPEPETETAEQSSSPILAAFAIGGVAIENAEINWDDAQNDQHFAVKEFNLNTGTLEFDQPVAIQLALLFEDKKSQLSEKIDLNTEISINESFELINIAKLVIDSHTQGENIPGKSLKAKLTSDIAIDLNKQTLDIPTLNLSSHNLNLNANLKGSQIKDNPAFQGAVNIAEFNLAKLMQQLAMPLPKMKDSSAMNKVAVKFNLSATPKSAQIQNLVAVLDESQLTGQASVNNFAAPAIQFKLDLDKIDADRYTVPKSEKSAKTVTSPAAATSAAVGLFPVDALRKLNANGEFNIGQLKVNQLKMQGLKLKLNAKQGIVKTQHTISRLYQGNYSGAVAINVKGKTPSIALNEKLSNVQVEPLLKDLQSSQQVKMSGTVNAQTQLSGYGNSVQAIKSSLGGNLRFNFSDSTVRGFNLQKIIDQGKSLLKGTPLPADPKNDQTVFSEISGTANIKRGLVSNQDLKAVSSRVKVNGQGTANLANDALNFTVNSRVTRRTVAGQPEQIKGIPVIFKIGGTLSKPETSLDIPAMLKHKYGEKIEEKKQKLLKKLDEKLGDKVSPEINNLIKGLF